MRKLGLIILVAVIAVATDALAQVDTAWVRASGYGSAYSVRADRDGNAYVCGTLENSHWRYDFLIRKYSPSGTLLWERIYDGGAGDDYSAYLELDSVGGVIVAGVINDSTYTNPDIGIVKYDTSGAFLWNYVYRGNGIGRDEPRDMAVTSAGEVILVGSTRRFGISQIVTIALNTNGTERWTRVHTEPTMQSANGRSITLGENTAYIGGSTSNGDALTLKYDLEGNFLWQREFSNGPESEQSANESCLDADGNLYIAGAVVIGSPALPHPADIFVTSYTPEGDLRWGGLLDSTIDLDEGVSALRQLSENNIGLLIREAGWPNLIANQGSRVVGISKLGMVEWSLKVPGRLSYEIATDLHQGLYLAHVSYGSYYPGGCQDIGLMRIDAQGIPQWSTCIAQPAIAWGRSMAFSVSADIDGSVYIAGEMSNRPAAAKVTQAMALEGLDLIPGACPNIINTGAIDLDYHGVRPSAAAANRPTVPVAILGTKTFDVSRVDPLTIQIAGLSPLSHRLLDVSRPVDPRETECECTTAGADGYTDLVLYFDQAQFVAALGPVNDGEVRTLALTGKTKTGVPLSGSDCVTIKESPTRISPLASAGEKIEKGFAAYPNPFNAATVVSFSLATDSDVRLDVYDVLGRRVATLVDDVMPAGEHQVSWDAAGWASGVYFARLSTAAGMMTRKMVLVR